MREGKMTLKITLEDLPPRPHKLRAEDMKDVFGGCSNEGGHCSKSSDCCEPLECYGIAKWNVPEAKSRKCAAGYGYFTVIRQGGGTTTIH